MVIAIITLISSYIVLINRKFNLIIASISLLVGAYYVGKSIIIYKKGKKEYLKEENDINKILKAEKRWNTRIFV